MNFSHYSKNPANNSFKLFVFDMDSTLIDAEVIDELAKAAGTAEEVSKITEAAMNGEMDYTESFQMRVSYLKGLSYEKALAQADQIQLMPGAVELIQYIHDKGGKTAMITCGFSLAADWVKKELNLDYAYSNELIVKDGILTGEATGPLMVTNAKADVLDELIQKTGIPYEECLVVGDGANDICMFKKAGYSIAFNAKPRVCEQACTVVSDKDLRGVIPILESVAATPKS
ncbi:Phosphoserine phosphatase SerB2 [Methanimicrococcus hongohii]|uniref:phosphoserine phosphatase n=1 Tax=Methanimicrococcus hongohii TaxID=3028295 RepID=A0AA96V1Y8_9EURY|nr:phosphoserine phosphatase SerB [Methanimicrococcus sp. Hf6]WNY23568.1 Phosphoserine phosphatase SerB2 [Methanimicrococcus sp. Hf6]